MSTWSEACHPGGMTSRARRRAQARKAGIASGVKRRQLARGRREPHARARSRQEALALKYPIRRVSRERFEQLYRDRCRSTWGVGFSQGGCDTAWALYCADRRLFDAVGQDALTTNGQRGAALSSGGRPRCRRTVQLTRKRLADMGLSCYHHVRRSGQRRIPGQLDCLRLRLLVPPATYCTPPSGASASPSGLAADAFQTAENGPSPPATPADDVGPPSAAGTETEWERALAFDEIKRRCGWTVPKRNRGWDDHASP